MMQTQVLAHSVSIMTEHKRHLMQQLYVETNVVYAETLNLLIFPLMMVSSCYGLFGEVLGHV